MEPVWDVLSGVGAALEVVGLIIALSGLGPLKADLFPGRPLPGGRMWRWVTLHVLRHPPRMHVGEAHADLRGRGTLIAEGHAPPLKPAAEDPMEAWAPYLLQRIEIAEEALGRLRLKTSTELAVVRKAIRDESAQRGQDVTRLEGRVAHAVGGEGGQGLDRTWYGLTLTLVGVALQGLASVAT